MAAVSQGLVDFANRFRQPAAPGIEVVETPRYRITLQPDYPVPGPNNVAWIRCPPDEVGGMVDDVRAVFRARRLQSMWILDPEVEPKDLPNRLAARGVTPDRLSPEVKVMVLGVVTNLAPPAVAGLRMHDALADAETFRQADAVNAEAFGEKPREAAAQERRRRNMQEAGNRRILLATIDGEPAGSAGLTLYPPHGAIITGGAVREKFRGRGVYRALVVERLRVAREAGTAGLSVWGGRMSAPTLERLGFQEVGWRRFYIDRE
jgi:GNAT superfamily N-acetyltransferase